MERLAAHPIPEPVSKIHLIQSREEFGPDERRAELRRCWHLNEGLFDEYTFPEGRPTFAELFALCKPDMVNVIANSDIYFDAATTQQIANFPAEGDHCWTLSRWDVKPDGSCALWDHRDSQDVYVVYSGPYEIDANTVMVRADDAPQILFERPFTQGIAGCDNRLLHVLREEGFNVSNPAKTIRTYHLHLNQYRSYVEGGEGKGRGASKMERIPPPYAFAQPTTL